MKTQGCGSSCILSSLSALCSPFPALPSWHQACLTQPDKRQKATLRGSWLCWKIYRLPGNIVHSAGRHITLQRRQLLRKNCNTQESVARRVSWLTEMGRKLILSQNWWCGCCFQVKKKQISEWDFEVGVLGQAKQCRAKEREEQGGTWDVDLGDIWELFVK